MLGAFALGAAKVALKLGVANARRADDTLRVADDVTRAIPPPRHADDKGWPLGDVVEGLTDIPFDSLVGGEDD